MCNQRERVEGRCKLQLVETRSLKGHICYTKSRIRANIRKRSRGLWTWRAGEGRTEAWCEDNAKHNGKGEVRVQRNNTPRFRTAAKGRSKDTIYQQAKSDASQLACGYF